MAETHSTFDAFISYSSRDSDVAFELLTNLEERGFKCWIAPRNVRPGHPFASEIVHGINRSRTLVVVHSGAANQSNHIKNEVKQAFDQSKVIIPIRVEDVEFTSELSYWLSSRHRIDAWNYRLSDCIDDIVTSISDIEISSAVQPGKKLKIPVWLWAVAGSAASVFCIFLVFHLLQQARIKSQIADTQNVIRNLNLDRQAGGQRLPDDIKLSYGYDMSYKSYTIRFELMPKMYFSGDVAYSFDGQTYQRIRPSNHPIRFKEIPSSDGVSIRFVNKSGEEKEFRKEIQWVSALGDTVRTNIVERLERSFELDVSYEKIELDRLRRDFSLRGVEAIEYGYEPESSECIFRTHPPTAERDRFGLFPENTFMEQPYPFQPGVSEVHYRYKLYDGTYGPWKQEDGFQSSNTAIEIEPEQGALPNNDRSPIVYGYLDSSTRGTRNPIELKVWPPLGFYKMHFDYDGRGFLSPLPAGSSLRIMESEGRTAHSSKASSVLPKPGRRVSPISIEIESRDVLEQIHLKFEAEDGKQTQIYSYRIRDNAPRMFSKFEQRHFDHDSDLLFFNGILEPKPKQSDYAESNEYRRAYVEFRGQKKTWAVHNARKFSWADSFQRMADNWEDCAGPYLRIGRPTRALAIKEIRYGYSPSGLNHNIEFDDHETFFSKFEESEEHHYGSFFRLDPSGSNGAIENIFIEIDQRDGSTIREHRVVVEAMSIFEK